MTKETLRQIRQNTGWKEWINKIETLGTKFRLRPVVFTHVLLSCTSEQLWRDIRMTWHIKPRYC